MAAKKSSKKTAKKKNPPAKKPRQGRLPGTEDHQIKELHSIGDDYMDARDQRMESGKEEKNLKDAILAIMKRHKIEHYRCDGLEITVVHEKEKIEVKHVEEESSGDGDIKVTSSKGKGSEEAAGEAAEG